MTTFFWYDANGTKQGPITSQELQNLVVQGVITPQTPLETDTGHKGKAKQIKGLKFPELMPGEEPENPFGDTVHHRSPNESQHSYHSPTTSSQPTLTLTGVGGCGMKVYNDKIVYTRHFFPSFPGLIQFMFHGIKGERTYFYPRITSIEFRKGKLGTLGYIRFFTGGNETVLGGVLPIIGILSGFVAESALRFNSSENDQAQEVYDFIESRIRSFSASKHS